jgi:ubiquinone/menaquinone biosynthesis C-methylase UbiE
LNKIKKILKKYLGVSNEDLRDQWLLKVLQNENEGKKLLDAGAGEQRNKKFCKHLEYISQDLCIYDGKSSNFGLQTGSWDTSSIDIVSDITSIPLSEESVDIVLCTEVLEHLPNPLAALNEFNRLLKPGGRLILTAPFSSVTHFAPYYYATGFSRYWYTFHLNELQFDEIEIFSNGGYYGLIYQELLRIIRKLIMEKKYIISIIISVAVLIYGLIYAIFLKKMDNDRLACLGYMVTARKKI